MYFICIPPSISRTANCQIDSPVKKTLQLRTMPVDAAQAVDELYRAEWGRIVASLIGLVGDFDLAEESAQEAFTAAIDQWRVSGIPEFPRAWIIQTARHKAIDRIRRNANFGEKLAAYAYELGEPTAEPNYDSEEIPDDRL